MEPALVGEEVDAAKAGGTGEELFTEEYETGDVGLKEYDYNYRDYNEPSPETAEVDGNIGPALYAVTDEGGVSRFASEAKTQKTFQPALQSIVKLHSVSRHVTCLSLHCRERLSYIKPYINSATDVLVANLLIWIQTLNIALRTGTEMILKHGVKEFRNLSYPDWMHQPSFTKPWIQSGRHSCKICSQSPFYSLQTQSVTEKRTANAFQGKVITAVVEMGFNLQCVYWALQ